MHPLTETTFAREVLQQPDKPVLVSFTGTWAREGEALAPIVEKIAADFADAIKVAEINFDEAYPLAGIYGVRSAPAVVLFQRGRKVGYRLGVTTHEDLVALVRASRAAA